MQGERSILESFPDIIDLNQGSSSHDAAMDRSNAWDNLLNPVESRLSNYALSAGVGNNLSVDNASNNGRTLGGWDPGESSSSANVQGHLNVNDLKIGPSWPPVNNCVATDGRSANWQFERPDPFLHESISNGYTGNYTQRPLSIHSSIPSRTPLNATSNGGHRGSGDDNWFGRGSGTSSTSYRPGRSQIDDYPIHGTTSDNFGSYSGSSGYVVQHNDGPSSSSSSWGLSCKRKAVEGNPSRPSSSGNLSSDMQVETIGRHTLPPRYNASSSLGNLSAPSMNLQGSSLPGQLNSRTGSGNRGGNYGFHPLSVNEVVETSERNFSFRTEFGQHEPVPLDLSVTRPDVRNPSINSAHHPPRFISTTELPEIRAPFSRPLNLNSTLSQSPMMQVPVSTRSLLPFPRNGSINLNNGASLGPSLFSAERGAALRDEGSYRGSQINHQEHSGFASPPETIPMLQEPAGWSFSHGNTNTSRTVSSSSRINPSSGSRPFPTVWTPHQNPTAHSQQRLAEFPPFTLFPPVEPEPGGQRGHFSFFPSASSSPEEAVMSSGPNSGDINLPYPRSLLMEVSSDDVSGWRAMAAATEGRQRIASEIRQVLTAIRRAENFRAEDHMVFDPFSFGAAEFHDRHRDMRLDVDNMSYEELLALEERIGNVNTGLSEDVIMRSMTQRKHHRLFVKESSNLEPCSICQEDYIAGDNIGILDCGHEFHTTCIKQWLTMKNLCPICKMPALET